MLLCKNSIFMKMIDLSLVVFVDGALRSLDWSHLAMPSIISSERKRTHRKVPVSLSSPDLLLLLALK